METTNMMMIATQISKVQVELKNTYGEEAYMRLVNSMKARVNKVRPADVTEIQCLSHIANDESMDSTLRLIAIAAMGE
jgi:hypothetical protein